jgi:hypothetical protein
MTLSYTTLTDVTQRRARATFNDIRGHGYRGSPDLRLKAEALRRRKVARTFVNIDDKLVGDSKYSQTRWIPAHTRRVRGGPDIKPEA